MQCQQEDNTKLESASDFKLRRLSETYDFDLPLNVTLVDSGFMCGANPKQLTF